MGEHTDVKAGRVSAGRSPGARSGPPVLALESVKKKYGRYVAINNVSFEVQRGEFLTLLGPSGCGKTSTLRLIAGFVRPDEGRVFLEGSCVNGKSPCDRDIGVVFQNYALFPHMTVEENVGFGLRMRGIKKAEMVQRVQESLSLVRLNDLNERYPHQLSGGQGQRVAIARALVIRPPLLLMDEPLSNLDALLRTEMQVELRNIVDRAGVTAINVTHNQEEALSMSDRVIVMSQGRIEQCGTPTEIYNRPANAFVAQFLGRSNLIQCRVEARTDEYTIGRTDKGAAVYTREGGLSPGQQLTLQVRPEAIDISDDQGQGINSFRGRVTQATYLGPSYEYLVHTEEQAFLVLSSAAGRYTRHQVGDTVTLRWRPEDTVALT